MIYRLACSLPGCSGFHSTANPNSGSDHQVWIVPGFLFFNYYSLVAHSPTDQQGIPGSDKVATSVVSVIGRCTRTNEYHMRPQRMWRSEVPLGDLEFVLCTTGRRFGSLLTSVCSYRSFQILFSSRFGHKTCIGCAHLMSGLKDIKGSVPQSLSMAEAFLKAHLEIRDNTQGILSPSSD